MSHFLVGALVPKSVENSIESYIEDIMSPYDENMRVPQYIEKTKEQILNERKERIEKYNSMLNEPDAEEVYNTENIRKSLSELESMTDEDYAFDKYYKHKGEDDDWYIFDENDNTLSTYNPKSKWDWWVVGGRWNGAIRAKQRDDNDGGFNFGDEFHQINENIISVEEYIDLLLEKDEKNEWKHYPPYAFVTEEDGWIEKGQMGWWGMSSNDKDEDVWRSEAINLLNKYKDFNIVGIDCHI